MGTESPHSHLEQIQDRLDAMIKVLIVLADHIEKGLQGGPELPGENAAARSGRTARQARAVGDVLVEAIPLLHEARARTAEYLAGMLACPNCGAQNPAGSNFCNN